MKPLLIFVSHNVFPNIIAKHTGPLNRILLKQEETSGGKHERRFRVNRGNCSSVHLPMATGLIRAGRTQQPPMRFCVRKERKFCLGYQYWEIFGPKETTHRLFISRFFGEEGLFSDQRRLLASGLPSISNYLLNIL